MKRKNFFYKKYIMIFLMLAVLGVIGYLPVFVSFFQDYPQGNVPQFEEMQSVELNLEDSLSLLEKFILMRSPKSIDLSPNETTMTQTGVEEVVLHVLEQYENKGLLPSTKNYASDYRPLFLWNSENPKIRAIVWDCFFLGPSEENITLAIDDETGKVLLITFSSEEIIPAKQRNTYMERFIHLFFSHLEIENFENLELEYPDLYVGEGAIARVFSFHDTLYGEINVVFYVHEYGFYVTFPEKISANEAVTD